MKKRSRPSKKAPAQKATAHSVDSSFENDCDQICVAICKAAGWPYDKALSRRWQKAGKQSVRSRAKRPLPFSDEVGVFGATDGVRVEFTDNKGRRLSIGPGRVFIADLSRFF